MYTTKEQTDKYGLKSRLYKVGRKLVARICYPNEYNHGKYYVEWSYVGLTSIKESEQDANECALRAVNAYLSTH